MAALTSSRSTIWNAGRVAACRACVTRRTPASRRRARAPAASASGKRMRNRRSSAGPYRCTTSSPGSVATASRTSSSVTPGCANSATTSVPPEKSIPSGRPLRRHRHGACADDHRGTAGWHASPSGVKLKLVFVKTLARLEMLSDCGCRSAVPQDQLEQRLRHEHRGEDVRHQSDRQRRRKPANGAGAELEQEGGGDERRDVGVDNRDPDAVEPGADGRSCAASRLPAPL